MARYPTLPMYITNEEIKTMYKEVQRWGSMLINELDSRDLELRYTPSTNIFSVVTIQV